MEIPIAVIMMVTAIVELVVALLDLINQDRQ